MVLYSPDWTNVGRSFIILIVNLFPHPTLMCYTCVVWYNEYIPRIVLDCGSSEKRLQTNAWISKVLLWCGEGFKYFRVEICYLLIH